MPRSGDFSDCNFITTTDRMQPMTTTKDEARLNLVEHIAGVLLYFYIDDDMSEEEIDDASNDCGDIASVLVQSMNLDIYDIESENSFKTSVNLKDFEKFMTGLQDRTVIGD
jgi:hypothetical protein